MNEMQAHGLLIPVGSKPIEVWIDKNNSLAELQNFVNGNVDVLRVLGNGVNLWVNDEGLFNGSKPNRAIYATKHMEEVGYLDQLTFSHPVKEGELYSLICGDFVAFGVDEEGEIASLSPATRAMPCAEAATEARKSSLVLSQNEGNHDDNGSDIGNLRPFDREYPTNR